MKTQYKPKLGDRVRTVAHSFDWVKYDPSVAKRGRPKKEFKTSAVAECRNCGWSGGYGESHKCNPQIKDTVSIPSGRLFDFPIRTFNPDNLLDEMLNAEEGTIFVLGEKAIKHTEGDDSVELTFVQIKKSEDNEKKK
jgi:hypothetical protein